MVTELRSMPGKDVWLFGGGSLFRSLAESHLVDTVEVAVIPVLLSRRMPSMAVCPPSDRKSKLEQHD